MLHEVLVHGGCSDTLQRGVSHGRYKRVQALSHCRDTPRDQLLTGAAWR